MATYEQLMTQKEALEAQLVEARATEVSWCYRRIQMLMTEYGLTVDDIATKRRRGHPAGSGAAKAARAPLPAKYRDPKTGKIWSRRGRAPAWLGKNQNRSLIAEE
ncbi:H-NS histone family protein [Cupriavidus nantongensis]|uniref:H-NS histone family protein n=1 Tax=Cupriavidus nantongensis TaxID=1796606 RepID=UPI00358FC777